MKINELRSSVMTRAVEIAKADQSGASWRSRISTALKDVWAAIKEVIRVAGLMQADKEDLDAIRVEPKVITVADILARYQQMHHYTIRTGAVTLRDINHLESKILDEVRVLPSERRNAAEGRTVKGFRQTKANLAQVLSPFKLKAMNLGIWEARSLGKKKGYEFLEKHSGDNLSMKGDIDLASAWATFYNMVAKEAERANAL